MFKVFQSLGKCKLKPQDTSMHLLGWLKTKTRTKTDTSKCWEGCIPIKTSIHCWYEGIQNGVATLEDSSAISNEINTNYMIQHSHS